VKPHSLYKKIKQKENLTAASLNSRRFPWIHHQRINLKSCSKSNEFIGLIIYMPQDDKRCVSAAVNLSEGFQEKERA
jgi:hypothetical protein